MKIKLTCQVEFNDENIYTCEYLVTEAMMRDLQIKKGQDAVEIAQEIMRNGILTVVKEELSLD